MNYHGLIKLVCHNLLIKNKQGAFITHAVPFHVNTCKSSACLISCAVFVATAQRRWSDHSSLMLSLRGFTGPTRPPLKMSGEWS